MAWLTGWSYRQSHNILSATGAGTNYQVSINVYSGVGVSSGNDVYLQGHCTDFSNDINFTADDGATELKFWIEDLTADPIKVWVKISADLDSNQTIYIYYGSSRTTSLADGTNTFVLFDHFLGTTLDTTTNWNAAGTGSNAVSGSILTITSDTGAGNGYYVSSKATYTGGYAVEMRAAQAGDATHSVFEWAGFVITAGSSSLASCTYCFRLNQADTYFTYAVYNAVPAGTIGNYSTAKDTNYHRCSARRSGANPDTCVLDGDSHTVNDAVNTAYYVTMEAYCNAAGYSGVIKIDWIAVRKYTATEPANDVWGPEETNFSSTTYPIDVVLEKLNIQKTNSIDVILSSDISIFFDGFEDWNVYSWNEDINGNGSDTDETIIVYAGNHSRHLHAESSNDTVDINNICDITGTSKFYEEYAFYISSSSTFLETSDPFGNNENVIIAIGGFGNEVTSVYKDSVDHKIYLALFDYLIGSTGYTALAEITLDAWHLIKIEYSLDVNGYVKVWFEGNLVLEIDGDLSGWIGSNEDEFGLFAYPVSSLDIGNKEFYFDNFGVYKPSISYNTATYDFDVILIAFGSTTKTNSIDVLTALRLFSEYSIDNILMKHVIKDDSIDVLLEKLEIIKTLSISVKLIKGITTNQFDVIFEKIDIPKTYGIDMSLAYQVFQFLYMDVLFKASPLINPDIDVLFSLIILQTDSIDVLLQKTNSSYDLTDVLFKEENVTTTAGIDCILLSSVPPVPPVQAQPTLHINNSNGDLWCFPLSWKETQKCTPAIRPIPLAESEYLDGGAYVIEPREITVTFRLSDMEKDLFESLYNFASNTGVNYLTNFYLRYNFVDSHHPHSHTQPPQYTWYYIGWITSKDYSFDYSMQDGRYVRWWTVKAVISVNNFSGSTANEPTYSNPFSNAVTLNSHKLVQILDFQRSDQHPPFIPNWVNRPAEVDSYIWNECVLDIDYTDRMSNDEKYLMDLTLLGHIKVNLTDYIHNVIGKVWVSEVEVTFDANNWKNPWKYALHVEGNNSEINFTTNTTVTVESWGVNNVGTHIGADNLGTLYMDELQTPVPLPSLCSPLSLTVGVHKFYFFLDDSALGFYQWYIAGDACLVSEEETYDVHTFDRESRASILIWGQATIIPEYISTGPLDPVIHFTSHNNALNTDNHGSMWLDGVWSSLPFDGHYSDVLGGFIQFMLPDPCNDHFIGWWTDNPSEIHFDDPTNLRTLISATGNGIIKAIYTGPDS